MDNKKFDYGLDVDAYIDKALEKIREEDYYYWADKSMFDKQHKYAIEMTDGEYHFVRYTVFSENDIEREELDVNPKAFYHKCENGDDFVKIIHADNVHNVYYANPKKEKYTVEFENGTEAGGWYLERYEAYRHESGDYTMFVQAGDRTTGGSRDFFIPPHFLKGTYEEFLDKYETLVPGDSFGLYKEDLIKDEGLKKFLGF